MLNVRWYSHFGRRLGKFKLHIHLPYALATPLLHICPREEEIYVHTKTYTQTFIADLLRKTKNWKQLK